MQQVVSKRSPYGTRRAHLSRSILELEWVSLQISLVAMTILLERDKMSERAEVVVAELREWTGQSDEKGSGRTTHVEHVANHPSHSFEHDVMTLWRRRS